MIITCHYNIRYIAFTYTEESKKCHRTMPSIQMHRDVFYTSTISWFNWNDFKIHTELSNWKYTMEFWVKKLRYSSRNRTSAAKQQTTDNLERNVINISSSDIFCHSHSQDEMPTNAFWCFIGANVWLVQLELADKNPGILAKNTYFSREVS